MTTHPVCPTHASAAKVCEAFPESDRGGFGGNMRHAELVTAHECAAAIRADCQSSGCAARWAKGLELAREARECSTTWKMESNRPLRLLGFAERLADHLEGL